LLLHSLLRKEPGRCSMHKCQRENMEGSRGGIERGMWHAGIWYRNMIQRKATDVMEARKDPGS
jgi:hypothetical protein